MYIFMNMYIYKMIWQKWDQNISYVNKYRCAYEIISPGCIKWKKWSEVKYAQCAITYMYKHICLH